MTQPIWITSPGQLGVFPSGIELRIQLKAKPVAPANALTYTLLNGTLPNGTVVLSSDGVISGIPEDVGIEQTVSFTVRVTDELGNIRDGAFSMTVSAFIGVRLTTPPGMIIETQDSTYVSYQIQFDNPVPTNTALLRVSSGRLPPGITLSTSGLLSGWPSPPIMSDKSPITREFFFTVTLSSEIGDDSVNYSIIVHNQQIQTLYAKRNPAILNNRPLSLPISDTDPYNSYYTLGNNILDTIQVGKYFSFKVIGFDFDRDPIIYNFSTLPPGLVGDTATGWVSGIPLPSPNGTEKYTFTVSVMKVGSLQYKSFMERFTLTIRSGETKVVTWNTPADLGVYNNGTVCDLKISATAETDLIFRVTSGSLPPNITLLPTGELVGRFPFQPERQLKTKGDVSVFNFEVSALANGAHIGGGTKQFTLSIKQRFTKPVETLYFKAAPNVKGRGIINSLVNNDLLIPFSYLYRPEDPNFGKASSIRIDHQYGVVASSTLKYLAAIPNNHYRQKYVFDELKTAIARDQDGNILYEVVYAQLIDPATNAAGQSVGMNIAWPQDIGLRYGEWYDSRTDKFTSSNSARTSFTPGYVKLLTPISLENMRKEIESNMVYDYDQSLLPKWMTSQQLDGNTLGFTEAWVICYTKPGMSSVVKSNIDLGWQYELSDIDFEIDRLIIDRSATYNWNTRLETPVWGNLPSAFPAPDSLEQYDDILLFNRETILPKT